MASLLAAVLEVSSVSRVAWSERFYLIKIFTVRKDLTYEEKN